MANKIYAILHPTGEEHKVYTWNECQQLTKGVAGILFKSFGTETEVDDWFNTHKSSNILETDVRIYVDGSFFPNHDRAGFGWVAIKDDEIISEEYGVTDEPALSRNIDGELTATINAVKWATANDIKATIIYDYEGIKHWAVGTWKAKKPVSKKYQVQVQPYSNNFNWEKVKGHSGDKWNDYVDVLAKRGIEEWTMNTSDIF